MAETGSYCECLRLPQSHCLGSSLGSLGRNIHSLNNPSLPSWKREGSKGYVGVKSQPQIHEGRGQAQKPILHRWD